jgi:hypothetical protein
MKTWLRMDKATKSFEWVKLIDLDYLQSMVKVWLKPIQNELFTKWSLENHGLKVQVSNLERSENVCTTIISSF